MNHKAKAFDEAVSLATPKASIMSATNRKADGTIRVYVWNPLDHNDIKGTGHAVKSDHVKEHLRRVRDLTYNPPQWRWIDTRTLIEIKVAGQIISVLDEEGNEQD